MGTVNVTLGDGQKLNLILGQQLENAVTAVVFDFSAWQTEFGSGTLGLSVQRHGDTQPYAVVPTVSGTNATWNISELDTAYKGVGEVQVTYAVGSVVKKSTVYKFTVYRSLGENGEYPSPGQTWQEEIEDELADVKQDLTDLSLLYQKKTTTITNGWNAVRFPMVAGRSYYVMTANGGGIAYASTDGSTNGELIQDGFVANTPVEFTPSASADYIRIWRSSESTLTAWLKDSVVGDIEESVDALNVDVPKLKTEFNTSMFNGYNLYNTLKYNGNNAAVTSLNNGSYTFGTTDFGRTFFGESRVIKKGTYLLYGTPTTEGNANTFLSTQATQGSAIVQNYGSDPIEVVIENDTELYLGFVIGAKPSTSFTLTPFLYSTKVEKALIENEAFGRSIYGNLYESQFTTWTYGYINASGQEIELESNILQYSDYIPCDGFKILYKSFVYDGSTQLVCGAFYDADMNYISGIGSNYRTSVPTNAKYIRLNRVTSFIERYNNNNYAFLIGGSKWLGKTISVLGDSITYGATLSNPEAQRWTTLLSKMTGATVNNYGVNSSKVSDISGDDVASFVDRRESVPNSDLIIIFGGTNDYWHHITPVGEADSYDVATFGGALNYLFNYYQTQYPSKKILYIFPMRQYWDGSADSHNFGYGSFNYFRQVAIGACANSGIPMLDLYATSGTNVANNSTQRNYYTNDGVHPNATGHALLANLIYTYIENQMSV